MLNSITFIFSFVYNYVKFEFCQEKLSFYFNPFNNEALQEITKTDLNNSIH